MGNYSPNMYTLNIAIALGVLGDDNNRELVEFKR